MTNRAELAGTHPEVSVVVPVYGRPSAAAAAIRSVLEQSVGNFEVVVVDDGSPVPAVESLAGFSDARIRFVRHDANLGAAAARNTGVEVARGPVVAFLDSDDVWLPTMLETQLAALAADATIAGVTTAFLLEHPDGRVERRVPDAGLSLAERAMLGCDLSPGSTLAIRRDVWLALGGLDAALARLEDWDFLLRLAPEHDLTLLDRPLARVRLRGRGPTPELVREATARIVARHVPGTGSPRLARRLRGTAHYEVGIAALRHRRPIWAASALISALILDPVKRSTLFARSFRRRFRQAPNRALATLR